MNIRLAVEAIGVKHSGGAVVLLDFLEAAISDPRVGVITVFCTPRKFRNFSLPSSSKINEIPRYWEEKSYFLRVLWYQSFLAGHCRNIGADVALLTGQMGVGKNDVPFVTFVQQPIPFSNESMRRLSYLAKEVYLFHSQTDTEDS